MLQFTFLLKTNPTIVLYETVPAHYILHQQHLCKKFGNTDVNIYHMWMDADESLFLMTKYVTVSVVSVQTSFIVNSYRDCYVVSVLCR